jgi:hypothetical protein
MMIASPWACGRQLAIPGDGCRPNVYASPPKAVRAVLAPAADIPKTDSPAATTAAASPAIARPRTRLFCG